MALIFWLAVVAFVIGTTIVSRERRRQRIARYAAAAELRTTNIGGHERSGVSVAGYTAFTSSQGLHPH